MLRNIIVTSLRNFYRNKVFSLINLVGLSVSMSLAMLILTIIHEQLSFDSFHADSDRLFRVNTHLTHSEWGTIDFACAPLPAGEVLKSDYGVASQVVRVNRQLRGEAVHGDSKVPLKGLFTEPSFLEVFHFPLQQGSAGTALSAPHSLVLTQTAAQKLFGRTDVIGQSVTIGKYGDFSVTGVLKDFSGKTHFDFEVLASLSTVPALERQGRMNSVMEDWSAYFDNYVYIKLRDPGSEEETLQALAELSRKYGTGLRSDGKDIGYSFYLQPLRKITPGPELSGNMGAGMPSYMVVFLGVLAAVVLLMSLFNFTNLTIAKSLTRAREIGVRKVVGAARHQVFVQFVGEAVIFSLIALISSYVLLQMLKAGFLRLSLREDFFMDLNENVSLYFIFVAFALVVGVLAGLLPAAYLSAFRPARVLKDVQQLKVYSRLTFRKILLVTQFTLSVVFVMVVSIVFRQLDFMLSADYGIAQAGNLTVDLQGQPFSKVAPVMRMLPDVVRVGGVSQRLGTWDGGSGSYRARPGGNPLVMAEFRVDENYVDNLSPVFLAGRNFEPRDQTGSEKDIVLNEAAVKLLGYASPADALGGVIYAEDTLQLRIIGVVKDFHFRPLSNVIGPLALRYSLAKLNYLSVQVHPLRQALVFEAVRNAWNSIDPDHPLSARWMEDEIDEAYAETGMQDMLVIVGYATFLVITLACLGMLGMAMYTAQTRAKEVGIRKVMGATSRDVLLLLSKSYLVLIALAIVAGMPVSYLAGEAFLESYPYRVTISPVLAGTVVLLIFFLSALIVWSQTLNVAMTNPVKWLRSE